MTVSDFVLGTLVGGVVAPISVSWVQHNYFSKPAKADDLRIAVMQSAARALALLESDALNPERQATKQTDGTVARVTSMRDETTDALGETRATVRATFTKATADLYDKTLRTNLSIMTNPNSEFEASRQAALEAMAEEIDLRRK